MEDSSLFSQPSPSDLTPAGTTLLHSSESGFTSIYRIDRGGRFRVLKCLKEEYRGSAVHEHLLRKEFDIGWAIRHPHIVEFYAFTHDSELGSCIEMEWVDGEPMEPSKAGRDDVEALLDAVSYLHSAGVIHRDLKPSNILVARGGRGVKVIDFGFADSSISSILKMPAGTTAYAAPELLRGGSADRRADIYSIGKILSDVPGIPRRVVRRCCQEDPSKRYSSVEELRKALRSKWFPAVAILIASLMAATAILWPRQTTPKAPDKAASKDTVIIVVEKPAVEAPGAIKPKKVPAPETMKQQKVPASKPTKNPPPEEDIDALFEEAAGLFRK